MAGLLDFIMGQGGASPWGALYPTQAGLEADQAQQARDAAAAVLASRFRGWPGVQPQAPALPAFGAGASPFGFAGPGSMNVDPSQMAGPAPVAPPAAPIAQAPVPPATDLSSINRPAPAPAEPDSVVPVGSYKMPMYGEAPDEEAAAPAVAAGARPAAAPFSLAGNGGGAGDRLMKATRGFFGNIGAGPIGALAGGLGALVTGQETDPSAIAQGRVNATGQALLSKGVARADVQAAVNNPALMTALIAQYYGKDKYKVVQTGEDGLGGKTYKLFNETDGTIKDIPGAPAGGGSGGGATPGLGNMDLKGEAYLATVPTQHANIMRGMVDGTIAPPSSFALAKPYWRAMIAGAKNLDPTFDETVWSARLAGAKDFASGKSSEMVRAANQTLHHTGQLLDSMDNLQNRSFPAWNAVANKANEMTGGGAPTAFRLNAHAVAEELSKVFKGANLSDAEIRQWEANLGENMSPEQQRAAIGKVRDLLQGSLHALEEKRVASVGPMAAEKQGPIIKPEGQAVLKRLDDWLARGNSPAPAASAAPKLAPGQSTTINGTQIRRVN